MSSKTNGSPATAGSQAATAGSHIKGDPFGESDLLVKIQSTCNDIPGIIPAAKAMSFFGEHAAGWMGVAAVGAIVDKPRRAGWVRMGVSAFSSHAASVIAKRVVRRPRPHDERIVIGVGTPSKLSFPSSHATSTTAALVSLSKLTGSPIPLLGVPAIMLSRLVLGVHYPTDVSVGAVLGASTALAVDTVEDATIDKAIAALSASAGVLVDRTLESTGNK